MLQCFSISGIFWVLLFHSSWQSPAISVLESSLGNPRGSQDLLFFSCFRTLFRSDIVYSRVLTSCACSRLFWQYVSLCSWCNLMSSLIFNVLSLSLNMSSVNSSIAFELVTRFPYWSSISKGGSFNALFNILIFICFSQTVHFAKLSFNLRTHALLAPISAWKSFFMTLFGVS